MKKWEDLKNNVKEVDSSIKDKIEVIETLTNIISTIIERRNKLGYSQSGLARICGLSHSSVTKIEAGIVKPKIETLIKILKSLGLTLSVCDISSN